MVQMCLPVSAYVRTLPVQAVVRKRILINEIVSSLITHQKAKGGNLIFRVDFYRFEKGKFPC